MGIIRLLDPFRLVRFCVFGLTIRRVRRGVSIVRGDKTLSDASSPQNGLAVHCICDRRGLNG